MALTLNKELFSKQEQLQELEQEQNRIAVAIREIQAKQHDLATKIPILKRDIENTVARIKQDLTARVARINSILQNSSFSATVKENSTTISIQEKVQEAVSSTVWELAVGQDGEYAIVVGSGTGVPATAEGQMYLFGKFQQIISYLK